jgi:toxin ParE1/3/4
VAAIKVDFDQLAIFPLSGVSRAHLAADLRVKFHGAYGIYYMPAARELIIVRVLHGARDAAAIAERGGFAD